MNPWWTRHRSPVAMVILACACWTASCNAPQKTSNVAAANAVLNPPAGLGLQTVTIPDVSTMEPSVHRQMDAQFSSLKSVITRRSSSHDDLAAAYGETGKLLMAATLLDAAEACFLNAQSLAPNDHRWPYYLGHVYKGKGPVEKSVASFERAQQLAPDDVATTVWLGDAYLSEGNADRADQLFAKVIQIQPSLAAARFGEGRAALAKREYQRAVDQLTEALAREPQSSSIHYPLAMAYRGLGDVKNSEAHLAQQGKSEPRPPDPLMREIDGLLQSPQAYNLRGGAELEAGHWQAAAEQFRRGLELDPNEPSLRQRFGTALYQMGDKQGAAQQFEQVLQTTPDYARAHFSLGVLLNDAGQYPDAIDHFRAALKSDPKYIEAHIQLAGALARSGHPGEAVVQYTEALDASPTNSDAAFGRAMAFLRLRRYTDAREALTGGMKNHPDQPMFAHALARLMAAAPDDRVRDGRAALKLVDELVKGSQSLELAETTAMALAEVGRFKEAVEVQRQALTAATDSGVTAAQQRIANNLRLYEGGKPCRTPFGDEELP
jgi:tetratricopeptide (TPR) repeat protein